MIYTDAAMLFMNSTKLLINFLNEQNASMWMNRLTIKERKYSKRDAFILMDADAPFYYDTNQYVNRLIQSKSNCEKYKMYLKLYRYNTHIFHYCAAFLLKSKGIPEGKGYIPLYGIKENLNQPKQMYIEDICYQENVELFKHVLEILNIINSW